VRSAVVAGVGGALLGHLLWLIGISLATGSSSVSTAVLVVSAALLIIVGLLVYQGWQCYQRKQTTKAAFLGGLALSPLIFTTIVLGVTYL
jgi:uncharacterized membrane protein YebE (DUF533 family)